MVLLQGPWFDVVNCSLNYAYPAVKKQECEALTIFPLRSFAAREWVRQMRGEFPKAIPDLAINPEKRPLMHDPFNARPVSGEIMTSAAAGPVGSPAMRNDRHEFIEAEFETLHSETGISRFRRGPAKAPESVALLRNTAREGVRQGERGGFAFWMAGAAFVILTFLASGGYLSTGGGRPAPASDGKEAASVPPPDAGAEAQGGPIKPHFLGTREDGMRSRGSFVFSDSLEASKDGEKSVSLSFGEEEQDHAGRPRQGN